MKKNLIILLIFISYIYTAFAQKYDYVWTFGYGVNLPNGGTIIDFKSGIPKNFYIKRQNVNFRWDCSSISDEKGTFLFATNGCIIIDSIGNTIKNGNGLSPGQVSDSYCTYGNLLTQGSMFLPSLTSSSQYYLFHIGAEFIVKDDLGGIGHKWYYTVIDKNGDNGKGEVIVKNKLIAQDTFAFGKLSATRHGNGRDWVAHYATDVRK